MSNRDLINRIEQLERRLRELEARENATFNASNILTGTLSPDRYSAYADLVDEGKLTIISGGIVSSDILRRANWGNIINDFTVNSPPPGWQWAGAPFVSPPETILYAGTIYAARGYTTVSRSFLYTTTIPNTGELLIRPFFMGQSVQACGIRMDDGTDNNYIEVVIAVPDTTRIPEVHLRWRTGGGSVSDVKPDNMSGWWLVAWGTALVLSPQGSRWSSWTGRPRIVVSHNLVFERVSTVPSTLTWSPARLGFVLESGTTSWEWFGVDWTNF